MNFLLGSLSRKTLVQGAGYVTLNGLIALFSWGHYANPAISVLLVISWVFCQFRWQIGIGFLSYFLVGSRDLPIVLMRFFPTLSPTLAYGLWIIDAAVLTIPFVLLWSKKPRASLDWRFVAALLLLAIPPLGIFGWLNPLIAAGYLFPGAGWLGLAALLLLLIIGIRTLQDSTYLRMGILWALAITAITLNINYVVPQTPDGWLTLSTKLGRLGNSMPERYARQESLIKLVEGALEKRPQAIVIFLPEEVAGTWQGSTDYWWGPYAQTLKEKKVHLFVGADFGKTYDTSHMQDVLIDVDTQAPWAHARQPIPVAAWRPWDSWGFPAHYLESGVTSFQNRRVAISFCYEDFLVWPHLISLIHNPDVLISVANNWFSDGLDQPIIQEQSIVAWARLFGIPLLRSVNAN